MNREFLDGKDLLIFILSPKNLHDASVFIYEICHPHDTNVISPRETIDRRVRAYLSEEAEKDLSNSHSHWHARAIRTLSLFWQKE
jgi:hypothetical protein